MSSPESRTHGGDQGTRAVPATSSWPGHSCHCPALGCTWRGEGLAPSLPSKPWCGARAVSWRPSPTVPYSLRSLSAGTPPVPSPHALPWYSLPILSAAVAGPVPGGGPRSCPQASGVDKENGAEGWPVGLATPASPSPPKLWPLATLCPAWNMTLPLICLSGLNLDLQSGLPEPPEAKVPHLYSCMLYASFSQR